MRVDPENRLVADSLEAEWNSKLRTLAEAQQECEQQRQQDRQALNDEQRAAVLALATDFPRLWRDPNTPQHLTMPQSGPHQFSPLRAAMNSSRKQQPLFAKQLYGCGRRSGTPECV